MASHLNTASRHKSKISMAAWARMFVCAGVLFAVIYVPSCVCVLQCFLYCTGAAQGCVRLLDQWQTGVLFITWWRMTDESLYESTYVHQAAVLQVENPLFKTTARGFICRIDYREREGLASLGTALELSYMSRYFFKAFMVIWWDVVWSREPSS